MGNNAQHWAKLKELASLEVSGPMEDNLYRLTCIVGDLLGARRVSLMLMDVTPGHGPRLKLKAVYGELPEAAWKEEPSPGQGIAGRVLAGGQSLHANRLNQSWRADSRRPGDSASFMACPVPIGGKTAGVLNASDPVGRQAFSATDLDLAELSAMLIGRTIQIARMDRLLDSRLAQMAFALEGSTDAISVTSLSAHDPDKVSRMLAKAFYREMRHCGFSPNQIIHAAGEIISELTGSLNRTKHRLNRG
jgi:L-methionine (R)-S-oxide reductase